MATGAAGDGLLRGAFEGCIAGSDGGIQRRPYHRNCSCELHKSRGHCFHALRYSNVSYPVRRSWSEGCLVLMLPSTRHPSPSSSPVSATAAADMERRQIRFTTCNEEEVEE